jgi:hypothetical protein
MADIVQVESAKRRHDRGAAQASALRRVAALWLPSIVFCLCLLGLWEVMARVTGSPTAMSDRLSTRHAFARECIRDARPSRATSNEVFVRESAIEGGRNDGLADQQ